jgi:hypothetical protein
VSTTTFTVTDSVNGAEINTSGTQSGVHSVYSGIDSSRYVWSEPDAAPSSTSLTRVGTSWINLDLASGSYILDGVDSIGFSHKLFARNLYLPPNINTYMATNPLLPDVTPSPSIFSNTDYHYLNIGSAVVDTLDPVPVLYTGPNKRNTYNRSRSYINLISSETSSGVEIASVYEALDETKLLIDPAQGIKKSSITTYIDESTKTAKVDISGDVTAGLITATTIRLTPAVDLSASSTDHNFQIGDSSGTNLRIDNNEIEALNNGAGSTLVLNGAGGGTVQFGGLLDSNDTYNNDITTTRRAMWMSSAGVFGYASSSRTKKQDIVSANIDVSSVLSIEPKQFRYIKAVEQFGEEAPVELGMIAEDLHDAGLTHFVDYDDDGVIQGIHYSTYVVALQAVIRDQAARLAEIERRLGI